MKKLVEVEVGQVIKIHPKGRKTSGKFVTSCILANVKAVDPKRGKVFAQPTGHGHPEWFEMKHVREWKAGESKRRRDTNA